MPKVTVHFIPGEVTVEVPRGNTILQAARLAGVVIEAPCNGAGHCGKCMVRVSPEFASSLRIAAAHQLSAGQGDHDLVLACHAEVHDDLTVQVLPRQEKELQIVTGGISRQVELDPFIAKSEEPTGGIWIRAGGLVIAHRDGEGLARVYGAVVDIGTTTLAVGLVNLETGMEEASASALNPQSLQGQDVLSRIRFCADPGGLETLQSSVIGELNRLLAEVAGKAGITLQDIYEVVFSGNSCMLHLATGVDPAPLGRLPFTTTLTGGNHVPAAEQGLAVAPEGLVWLPPVISAYVGADISAGILAAELDTLAGVTLFIDIGTNGEMVLARDGSLVATATAAGPAFEGMNISCGMRAASGAIEGVAIDTEGNLTMSTIGGAAAIGICGSGLMDLVAELVRTGVIGQSGRFNGPGDLPPALAERVAKEEGRYRFRLTDTVSFTQKDVRQVQLAKGAIRAGIDLLLEFCGAGADEVDRIYIAGSFGFHLREESLLTIGLLPLETAGKVTFLGNTAKSGGEMLLLDHRLRSRLKEVVDRVRVLELAANPRFERAFMEAMSF